MIVGSSTKIPQNTFIKFLVASLLILSLSFQNCLAADNVVILDNNTDALAARLELIKNAQDEILITTYIFADDFISRYILAELQVAVERGVSVKLVVDASNNYLQPRFIKYINKLGIETKLYNRFKGYNLGKFVKYRLHAKILLVDQNKLIIGGRNIGCEYFGLGQSNYRDRDVYIEGESVSQVRKHFFAYFDAKESKLIKKRPFWSCLNNRKLCERKELEIFQELFAIKLAVDSSNLAHKLTNCDWGANVNKVDSLFFFVDKPDLKKKNHDGLSKVFLETIELAKERVIIESPYLVLFHELENSLRLVHKQRVPVRVLTNSISSTDGLLAHSGYITDKKYFLDLGVELYEFDSNDKLHSKTLLCDDRSVIGSVNLDPRSYYLNKEIFVLIDDKEFAETLLNSMLLDFSNATSAEVRPRQKKEKEIIKRVIVNILNTFVTPRVRNLL